MGVKGIDGKLVLKTAFCPEKDTKILKKHNCQRKVSICCSLNKLRPLRLKTPPIWSLTSI